MTKWRDDLEQLIIMEVVDQNRTAAVLIKPESFKAPLTYLDQIDKELEQAQVEVLFGYRGHLNDWSSGKELAIKAKINLQEKQEHIQGLLNDDK